MTCTKHYIAQALELAQTCQGEGAPSPWHILTIITLCALVALSLKGRAWKDT